MSQFTYLKIPTDKWDVLAETLSLDADAGNFDPTLRREIREALDAIEYLPEPLST